MEPRSKLEETWKQIPPPTDDVEGYYLHCLLMCEEVYADTLEHYRALTPDDVDVDHFFREYVWCVYASGFSTRILTEKFPALMSAYRDLMPVSLDEQFEQRWERVKTIIGNRGKHDAVHAFMLNLVAYAVEHGTSYWDKFKEDFFNVDALQSLPFIGEVNRFHLARNIGIDCVKPDRHLMRLAQHFGFDSPQAMCELLAGLHDERVGVVDLVLFYGASLWGTNTGL